MEKIEKQSDTEVKITIPQEVIITLVDLKQKVVDAQISLSEFEEWVINERNSRQQILDNANNRVNQAISLGISEVALAEIITP